MHRLITLTTDFGEHDFYVPAMKGVIVSRCPGVTVMDLSHGLPGQDVMAAALLLEGAALLFPEETVHVVVVDPGVGTARRPIVARVGGQYFVCPDNGLLTLILKKLPLTEARIITNPECMTSIVSKTFHGRDVFAPTAAFLASGNPFTEIGPIIETLHTLDTTEPVWSSETLLRGTVLHVDSFGTLVSNVMRESLKGRDVRRVQVGPLTLEGLGTTFGDVPPGEPVAYLGSGDRLEIAVNCGRACDKYGVGRNETVEVEVS